MSITSPRPALRLAGCLLTAALLLSSGATAETLESAAQAVAASINDLRLQHLLNEVLERNPEAAALAAAARATQQRAPQARALPDPMAELTLFLLTPETRVGPQQAAAGISQKLPWFGKLGLKERAALLAATAAHARVEARRLELVTETRRLYHELAFLDAEEALVREDRLTLEHYEELARARYASGVGLGQAVVKLQAEITTADSRLLQIFARRSSLLASLNSLRDQPGNTPVKPGALMEPASAALNLEALRRQALAQRPELAELEARIARAETLTELARARRRPDVTVGLRFIMVGRRDDPQGRVMPPAGNGDDILGLTAGANLPIWSESIEAGISEAVEERLAVEQKRRSLIAGIDAALTDRVARIRLLEEQIDLYEQVLEVQAEQSLSSAEAGYAAGTAGALDLLDAERTLLRVRIAAQRARADLAIVFAELQGVVAGSLHTAPRNGSPS